MVIRAFFKLFKSLLEAYRPIAVCKYSQKDCFKNDNNSYYDIYNIINFAMGGGS